MSDPYPYDLPPKGVKFWAQRFPNAGPDRTPRERPKVKGRDGVERDHLTGLGVRRAAAPRSPDEMVSDWRPVE